MKFELLINDYENYALRTNKGIISMTLDNMVIFLCNLRKIELMDSKTFNRIIGEINKSIDERGEK
jgi:hypothetical protein